MRSPKEVIETYLSRAREWATLPDDLTVHMRRLGLAAMTVLAVNQLDPLKTNISADALFSAELDAAIKELEALPTEGLTGLQQTTIEKAKNMDPIRIKAIAIKESFLKEEPDKGGYLQITTSASKDLQKLFTGPAGDIVLKEINDSSLTQGILYLAYIEAHYIEEDPQWNGINQETKQDLAHLFYNRGPSITKKMLADLKIYTSDSIVNHLNRLGLTASAIPEDKPLNKEDETYKITRTYLALESAYLKDSQNDALNKPIYNASPYPTAKDLAIGIRYLESIRAIRKALTEDAQGYLETLLPKTAAQLEKKINKISEPQIRTQRHLLNGSTPDYQSLSQQYGISEQFLKDLNKASTTDLILPDKEYSTKAGEYLHSIKKDQTWILATNKGYWNSVVQNTAYKAYLDKEVELEDTELQEAIWDFNQKFNPEFIAKNISDPSKIPHGVYIWVPNAKFFIDYQKGDLRNSGTAVFIEASEGETPSVLSKFRSGQYVQKRGAGYILDTNATKIGNEKFKTKTFENHPIWNIPDASLGTHRGKMEDIKYIILHSTISPNSNGTIAGKKAHFVVEKNGTIQYLVSVEKGKAHIAPHAGISRWNGDQGLNSSAIGIEVVAEEKTEWTDEQKTAIKKLTEWLGGYYELPKNAVLTHYQVASSIWGRGRKTDPYGSNTDEFWEALGLPPNYALLDLVSCQKKLKDNSSAIKNDKNGSGIWLGLEACKTFK